MIPCAKYNQETYYCITTSLLCLNNQKSSEHAKQWNTYIISKCVCVCVYVYVCVGVVGVVGKEGGLLLCYKMASWGHMVATNKRRLTQRQDGYPVWSGPCDHNSELTS